MASLGKLGLEGRDGCDSAGTLFPLANPFPLPHHSIIPASTFMGVYGHDMDQRRHDGDWVMVDVSLPLPSDDDEHARPGETKQRHKH